MRGWNASRVPKAHTRLGVLQTALFARLVVTASLPLGQPPPAAKVCGSVGTAHITDCKQLLT